MGYLHWWLTHMAPLFPIFWAGGAVALAARRYGLDRPGRAGLTARLAAAAGVAMMVGAMVIGSTYYRVLWSWAFVLLLVSVFTAVVWKGDWRARVLIGWISADTVLGSLCSVTGCLGGGTLEARLWRAVAVDIVTLAICLAMVAGARRYWVLWTTSFVVLWLATDVLTLATPGLTSWAFAWASFIWEIGFFTAVLWGVFQRWREGAAASAGAGPAPPPPLRGPPPPSPQ